MAKTKGRAKRRPPPIEHGILLTATLCLLAGGAVMVYSASSARDLLSGAGDGTGYLERYLFYGAIGLLAMRFLSRHGLEAVRRATPMLLLVALRAAHRGHAARHRDRGQRRPPLGGSRPASSSSPPS